MKIVWLALLYGWNGAPVTVVEVSTAADCLRLVRVHTHQPDKLTTGLGSDGRCVQVHRPL